MRTMNRKKIIKGICFVFLLLLLFLIFQRTFRAKWVNVRADGSFNTSLWMEYRSMEPNSIDVLFLGTSHAYSAIDPMYIYEQSGITSFLLAGPGSRMDLSYLSLEEALKTQSPEVVVLDVSGIQFSGPADEARAHKVIDQLPISKLKLEFAFDNGNEDLKPLDVLFPFFRYHSRWADLKEKDFKYLTNDLKLINTRGHFVSYKNVPTGLPYYEDMEWEITDRSLEYLKRIKDLCDEKGTKLLMIKVPAAVWHKVMSDCAQEIAETFGVPWLDLFFEVDEMGLDVATDYRDKTDHMNQWGAEKVSAYMIKYLQSHYELGDHRPDKRWEKDLVKYKKLLQERLEAVQT